MSDATLAEGRFARFVRRDDWEFVERKNVKGIVCIAALTAEGEVVLVEQERRPVGARVIEPPAGLCGDSPESRDEPLEVAARRELLEETGYEAEHLEPIFRGTPSAGILDEVIDFFRATGLRRVAPGGGDASESITVHTPRLTEIDAWIADQERQGKIVDIKVHAVLRWLERDPRKG